MNGPVYTHAPNDPLPPTLRVIDSHTEGEPTRVVLAPDWLRLEGRDMAARRDELRTRHDTLRSAVVCEPRGHDAVVGALLTPPVTAGAAAGVIFFNNVGFLGMCGHGLIGVVRTLEHLGQLEPGTVRIDTPVGPVAAELGANGEVTIRNVPPRVHALDVGVAVPGLGLVTGDVAYGGNWFFITRLPSPALELANVESLTRATQQIRDALAAAGITGADGAEIDHIELWEPSPDERADARNFVLCPGGAYDRSPCGTGTSAKLAVLHARGQLAPDTEWRQSSVTGGVFHGWLSKVDGALVPFIRGRAFITADATLHFDPRDPFRTGFTSAQGSATVEAAVNRRP
jgi:4-hydroxyproline epimerase